MIQSPRVLLLLTPFVLMAPVWLAGKALYWGTPSTQFIPWWWQAWRSLQSAELPLWNPLVGAGAPLLANYQSALLYPPTWIYFALAAMGGMQLMAWGQALIVAAHLAWAAWGMGLLIRRLGKGELAQTVGGLAFGLSGYLVARAHFLSINAAVAWLPWILLTAYDLVHKPDDKRNILKLALVLALQWLAGHAQTAWYTLILAVFWSAFWAWKSGKLRGLRNAAPRFALAGLLAFGLSAAQLLPTAEYLMNSQRSWQLDFTQTATYSFWPWRLIGLVAPNFFGNPAHGNYWGYGNFWEDDVYVGLLPFILALAALWWARKSKQHRSLLVFLIIFILISFILAIGNNTPLFEWLFRNVPTFALFQSPTRFSIWMIFALALLAAFAVGQWEPPTGRALYWSRLAAAAAIAILLGAGIGWFLADHGALHAPNTYFSATAIAGVIGLGAAILNLRRGDSSQKSQWNWWVGGLVAVDLLVAGWGLNPGTGLELYKGGAAPMVELGNQLGEGRVYIPEADEYRLRYEYLFRFDDFFTADPEIIGTSMLPNTTLLDGIPSANNYDPLLPARYKEFIETLNSGDAQAQKGMLARLNVSLLETLNEEENQFNFKPVEALPRARWATCIYAVNDSAEALLAMSKNLALDTVAIEGRGLESLCEAQNTASVQIQHSKANSMEISVDASTTGWLLVSDTFFPGWQAFVNGSEATILPTDGMFRAVHLDPGHSDVLFVYNPAWFYVGFVLSTASWFIWFIRSRHYKSSRVEIPEIK